MKDVISFAHPQYIPMEYIGTEYLSNIHFFLEDAFFFQEMKNLVPNQMFIFAAQSFKNLTRKTMFPDVTKRI